MKYLFDNVVYTMVKMLNALCLEVSNLMAHIGRKVNCGMCFIVYVYGSVHEDINEKLVLHPCMSN